MTSPQRICFVIYDGFELLDLTGPFTVLSAAARKDPEKRFELCVAARETGQIRSANGLTVMAEHRLNDLAQSEQGVHSLVCVGGDQPQIGAAIADKTFTRSIAEAGQRAQRRISVCSGTFFLAASGLARQRRVTTHWRAAQRLARAFPDLSVDSDALYVQDGPVWTSAGVTAGIDLTLTLVEQDFGREAALAIARNILVPRIRSGGQSQYSAELAAQDEGETRLARLFSAVRREPEADWQIDNLCELLHVSRRTLTRLCQSETGLSPAQLVERLRLDRARSHLVETDAPLGQIARRSGFATLQRMERAFQRQMSTTPREFRARFRSPYAQESFA